MPTVSVCVRTCVCVRECAKVLCAAINLEEQKVLKPHCSTARTEISPENSHHRHHHQICQQNAPPTIRKKPVTCAKWPSTSRQCTPDKPPTRTHCRPIGGCERPRSTHIWTSRRPTRSPSARNGARRSGRRPATANMCTASRWQKTRTINKCATPTVWRTDATAASRASQRSTIK